MPRQILIVDAVATNRIVLKVKLASAFYNVVQARTGQEALSLIRNTAPAVVLIGTLRDMSPLDLCDQIKIGNDQRDCAVVMLVAEDDAGARLLALRAGADDVIGRPYDDAILLARLRSLFRFRDTEEELRLRESTNRALGLSDSSAARFEGPGLITLIAEDCGQLAARVTALRKVLPHRIELRTPREMIRRAADARKPARAPDAFLLALTSDTPSSELQFLPESRSWDGTRRAGVLVLAPEGDRDATASALDLGADDVASDATSIAELALRLDRLVQRKRRSDALRNTVRDGLRAAVTDPLTGLHNRRFALPHLARVVEHATQTGRTFSVMIADLDFFKRINDMYGHAAGDAVLIETAKRLLAELRSVDLVARIGGEEFLIVLPDIAGRAAQRTADRLRAAIADRAFDIPGRPDPVPVTISIGVTLATARPVSERDVLSDMDFDRIAQTLIARADSALYGAKAHGRNQVELSRPAA